MATSDPQLPSSLDAAAPKGDRRGNASPPPAQSKRDKKRQLLAERLISLSEKFTRDRDLAYREQLQKIQIDTSLVMRVDPYADRPLDFLASTRKEREHVLSQDGDQDGRGAGRSLLEMAGPTFHDWHQRIEDLVEERDFELTKQKVSLAAVLVPGIMRRASTDLPPAERVRRKAPRARKRSRLQDRSSQARALCPFGHPP